MSAGLSLCYARFTLGTDHTTTLINDNNSSEEINSDEGKLNVKLLESQTPVSNHYYHSLTALTALLHGRYKYVRTLGYGAFATTIHVLDLYNPLPHTHYAIKVMSTEYGIIGVEEAKKLQMLNHSDLHDASNVVRLRETFTFRSHFCLVFELLQSSCWTENILGPRMLHRTGTGVVTAAAVMTDSTSNTPLKIKSSNLKHMAKQLLISLHFLRTQDIIHADIKPENILFDMDCNCKLKLIDFGNAFTLSEAESYYDTYQVQSLLYRAPEVLMGVPFDYSIDMWSVGVVLLHAWLGRPPFVADTLADMSIQIRDTIESFDANVYSHGKLYSPEYSTNKLITGTTKSNPTEQSLYRAHRISELLGVKDMQLVYFMAGILAVDPSQRFTPQQALEHPFLQLYRC